MVDSIKYKNLIDCIARFVILSFYKSSFLTYSVSCLNLIRRKMVICRMSKLQFMYMIIMSYLSGHTKLKVNKL